MAGNKFAKQGLYPALSIEDNPMTEQVFYNDKWVPKSSFVAFVYSKEGEQRLCKNYTEYESAIGSGLWHSEPKQHEVVSITDKRGKSNDTTKPAGKSVHRGLLSTD
jgi:hypothetical protein